MNVDASGYMSPKGAIVLKSQIHRKLVHRDNTSSLIALKPIGAVQPRTVDLTIPHPLRIMRQTVLLILCILPALTHSTFVNLLCTIEAGCVSTDLEPFSCNLPIDRNILLQIRKQGDIFMARRKVVLEQTEYPPTKDLFQRLQNGCIQTREMDILSPYGGVITCTRNGPPVPAIPGGPSCCFC